MSKYRKRSVLVKLNFPEKKLFFSSLSLSVILTDRNLKAKWRCSRMQEFPQSRKLSPLKCQTTPSSSQVHTHALPCFPVSHYRIWCLSCPFFFLHKICNISLFVVFRHSSVCSTFPSRPVCGRHSQIVSSRLPAVPPPLWLSLFSPSFPTSYSQRQRHILEKDNFLTLQERSKLSFYIIILWGNKSTHLHVTWKYQSEFSCICV